MGFRIFYKFVCDDFLTFRYIQRILFVSSSVIQILNSLLPPIPVLYCGNVYKLEFMTNRPYKNVLLVVIYSSDPDVPSLIQILHANFFDGCLVCFVTRVGSAQRRSFRFWGIGKNSGSNNGSRVGRHPPLS